MIRLSDSRIARLRKMDMWELHHEHPQMFLTEHLFNSAKQALNENLTREWHGPGSAPTIQITWKSLGHQPTLFGTLNKLPEKQRTAFLLECTLIWESTEEYLEAEHEQNRIARAAVVRSQSALATA